MISVEWREYTEKLNQRPEPLMKALTEEAKKNGVPIMQPEAMSLVEQFIRVKNPPHILEIGTAVGWSAINMANAGAGLSKITTVERDPQMVEQAKKNIMDFQLESLIEVLEGDVLELSNELSSRAPFDMILIDAGKGHYQEYFMRFLPMLKADGIIICDNVYFRGYAIDPEQAPKRLKRLAQKMSHFNEWLMANSDVKTIFVPVGDGLSISTKNNCLR